MNFKSISGRIKIIAMVTVLTLVFAGCATHSMIPTDDPPGFFSGLLHGFIILFSFIAGFFGDYQIYNIPNSGGWYNFGYLIGVSMFFGGGAGAGKRCK